MYLEYTTNSACLFSHLAALSPYFCLSYDKYMQSNVFYSDKKLLSNGK